MEYKIEMREYSGYPLGIAILKWTTEPPTQTGLYRAIAKDNGMAYWVELTDLGNIGIFSVYYFGNNVMYSVSDFTHWLGPLPVPEPPENG